MQINDGFSSIKLAPPPSNIVYPDLPPAPLLKAIENDDYTKGDATFSVTELMMPSRIVSLLHSSGGEQRTPFNMMDSLMGRAIHKILEDNDTEITEQILYTTILDHKIKGQFDRYVDDIIEDYKSVKVSAFKAKTIDNFYDWSIQLNCYASMLREHGLTPEGLRVHAFLKDWSPIERDRSEDYPRNPWPVVNIPLMPDDEIRAWMTSRVKSHLEALPEAPLCSEEDRWADSKTVALMKKGKARAVKLFPDEESAREWATYQSDSGSLYLQIRPSVSRRCLHYCPVAHACTQWAGLQEAESQGPVEKSLGPVTPSPALSMMG